MKMPGKAATFAGQINFLKKSSETTILIWAGECRILYTSRVAILSRSMPSDRSTDLCPEDDVGPPVLSTWNKVYGLVLAYLVLLILGLHVITKVFGE